MHCSTLAVNGPWVPTYLLMLVLFSRLCTLIPHLTSLVSLYRPSRVLQSSFYSNLWQVSRANVIFGSRSFRVAAPTIWNALASWSVYLTHLILTNGSTLIRIFCKQLLCGLAPGRINSNVVIVISLTVSLVSDSEWQWHQLGHMQVCTSLQTDNHASTPALSFFTGRMPFLPPNQQRQSTEIWATNDQ